MLAVTERHKLLRSNLKCMSRVTAGILQQSSAGPPKGCAGPVANHSQGTYDVIIVKQEKRSFTIYCILSCSDAARTYNLYSPLKFGSIKCPRSRWYWSSAETWLEVHWILSSGRNRIWKRSGRNHNPPLLR